MPHMYELAHECRIYFRTHVRNHPGNKPAGLPHLSQRHARLRLKPDVRRYFINNWFANALNASTVVPLLHRRSHWRYKG